MINIDDFFKVELKVGTVLEAEDVEGSEKLIKLQVDLGPKDSGVADAPQNDNDSNGSPIKSGMTEQEINVKAVQKDVRQILSGVKQWYKPEDFVGKQVVVIANLEPRKMMGMESQGMLLAAEGDPEEGPVFLTTPKQVSPGAKIR